MTRQRNKELKVHTFITLSTPHRGSVGADYIRVMELTRFFPLENTNARTALADLLSLTYSQNKFDANNDLTTWRTTVFNRRNRLSNSIQYHSVGADADINGNGTLERNEYQEILEEGGFIVSHLPDGIVNGLMNSMYQALGNFQSATIRSTGRDTGFPLFLPIYELFETPTSHFQENDMMVTVNSAKFNFNFIGQYDKNHASVADGDVASSVMGHLKYAR